MSESSTMDGPGGPDRRRRLARLAYGAFVGGVMGFTLTALALQWLGTAAPATLTLFQGIALIITAATGAIGGIMVAMSFSRRLYNIENQSDESDPEEYGDAAPLLRFAGTGLLATAVQFAALALPPERGAGDIVLPLIMAALLVQLWANWQLWQRSDELRRAVTLEGAAIALAAIILIISLWAPLAIYGHVGFDPLAVVIVITLANLVPSLWITHRRGL